MNCESIKKVGELTYTTKGVFKFKNIEFNIEESIFLADAIGNTLTGKDWLVSKEIPSEQINDKRILEAEVYKRIYSKCDVKMQKA
jgi:hypothetical protein